MDFIVVAMADGTTLRRDLDVSKLSIGRASDNELIIADLSLSRVHAEIWREADRFLVKDAASKNGTLLNGTPVTQPMPLTRGDQITIGQVNLWFNAEASHQFISLFVAELEPEGGLLRYVNAGHNRPVLLTASGRVEQLSGGGPVLGILPGKDYPSSETPLSPGDTLLLYSDGATESVNPQEEEFGEERLIEQLRQVATGDPEAALTRLKEAILGFCGTAPRHDDITLLVMRRSPK